jgi:hypothetical protein
MRQKVTMTFDNGRNEIAGRHVIRVFMDIRHVLQNKKKTFQAHICYIRNQLIYLQRVNGCIYYLRKYLQNITLQRQYKHINNANTFFFGQDLIYHLIPYR